MIVVDTINSFWNTWHTPCPHFHRSSHSTLLDTSSIEQGLCLTSGYCLTLTSCSNFWAAFLLERDVTGQAASHSPLQARNARYGGTDARVATCHAGNLARHAPSWSRLGTFYPFILRRLCTQASWWLYRVMGVTDLLAAGKGKIFQWASVSIEGINSERAGCPFMCACSLAGKSLPSPPICCQPIHYGSSWAVGCGLGDLCGNCVHISRHHAQRQSG